MFKVQYAIQYKTSKELLSLEVRHETWMDGDYEQSESNYELETDGQHGVWTTDSLLFALIIMSSKKKSSNAELPYLSEYLRKNCEIVAIHSFDTGFFKVSTISSSGVEQNIENVISNDDILRAKYTSENGDFDEVHYNHILSKFGTDFEDIYKIEPYDSYKLQNYLEKKNRLPFVKCDVLELKQEATRFIEDH